MNASTSNPFPYALNVELILLLSRIVDHAAVKSRADDNDLENQRTGQHSTGGRRWDQTGQRREESTGTADWKKAQKKLRERLQTRDDNVLEIVRKGEQTTAHEWVEFFLEHYSKPPLRSPKTHESHQRTVNHLKPVLGDRKLIEISLDWIEGYLRMRLRSRVRRKTKAGVVERGVVKPSTVHQEFRVIRRILNVAVRKRLLPSLLSSVGRSQFGGDVKSVEQSPFALST